MAVTTAKIRAREKATGKKAYTGIDYAGNLHYAFDNATLQSIIQKSNVAYSNSQSAKAFGQSLSQSNANNAFNAQMAQNQMNFQERMSNTSHQREVKDLIAAGLNPVLSANGGASTPSGSSATADNSTAALKAQMFMQQLNAGVQLAVNRQNIESAQKMAKWQNDLNREISHASLQNQKDIANISAAASMYGADQASSASRYSADSSAGASRYAADTSAGASRYSADTSAGASRYAADQSAGASRYASDTSRYNSRMDRGLRTREYESPNNTYGVVNNAMKQVVSNTGKAFSNFYDTSKNLFDTFYEKAVTRSRRSRHR